QEERLVADWLFFHGVRYQYERDYEHPTRTRTHQQYRPDFYYPDAALYHEHFALDRNGKAPAHFTDYLAGVRWKRQCHAEHETDLFETTSHDLRNGRGLEGLAAALRARGVEPVFDAARPTKGQPPISTRELAALVRAFQQQLKGGGIAPSDIAKALEPGRASNEHVVRASRFLSLYDRIAEEWERRLQDANGIDFDDMLIQAAELIENGAYQSPYKMIFADEFQDSSRARVRLLKALLDQTRQRGHLCVVGDDWQSINRFAGADLSVMTAFKDTFPHSSQLGLATTFRCPQSLCDASSRFVSANPSQLGKDVRTTNPRKGPSIIAYAFPSSEEALDGVGKHLERLRMQAASGDLGQPAGRLVNVLLLGRYNHERPGCLDKWKRQFRDQFQIDFRTVHSAKGLEADYVMILNMIEDAYGFPSQLAEDPVLRLAMPEADDFPMAEERRVFYVALTRARRQVRIYTKTSSPSRFLVEMAKNGLIDIRLPGGVGA
ncbi:UvrD-helicase domain-containing protein, partial [Cereibacter sphaeroides]|uniref:UvrD-helicase domain-containing protein n=1 Tax=Cereibacter sphaeroides TaxID=1063 RepID=UPI001F460B80